MYVTTPVELSKARHELTEKQGFQSRLGNLTSEQGRLDQDQEGEWSKSGAPDRS